MYLPVRGSRSYVKMPDGMQTHQEEQLRKAGVLFAEPDSRIKLSAGLGRHWPDARGVFLGESQSFYVWCNEEDHLRFFARQSQVVDLKALWTRIDGAASSIQKAISS